MDSLPDSVLLHIFSFLKHDDLCLGVRLCSRKWHDLSLDKELWERVDVPGHFSDHRLYLILEQIHGHVETLDLSQCDNVSQNGMLKIADLNFPRLKKLSVPIAAHLSDKVFVKLARTCPKLEELDNVSPNVDDTCNPLLCQMIFDKIRVVHDRPVTTFGRIRLGATNQTDDVRHLTWSKYLDKFAESCEDVNQIVAYKCSRGMGFLNQKGLVHVGSLFPCIRRLELRNCSINNAGLEGFFTQKRNQGLTKLTIDKPGDDISDDGLKTVADHCPNLLVLHLTRCPNVTCIGVQYLLSKCHNIVDLHLNNSSSYLNPNLAGSDIDDGCLAAIGENCPNLLSFKLFYSNKITSYGIGCLTKKCTRLRGLMLFDCHQVNDSCFQIIQKCRNLVGLILVNCGGVTPRGLIDLVLLAPQLTTLTFFTKEKSFLKDVTQLAEDIYKEIDDKDNKYRPNVLQKLTLRGVGSAFLKLITVLCPNLRLLDLRSGCQVCSHSVVSALMNCELLGHLDLALCLDSDKTLLDGIVAHGAELSHLSLGGNKTDDLQDELCRIIAICPLLKSIALDLSEWKIIDIDFLTECAKKHHGGNAHQFYEKGFHGDDEDKYVELFFTPLKYLGSVPGSLANKGSNHEDTDIN